MAKKQGTELRFVATIGKVEIATPKKTSPYANEPTGGGLKIVLDIPFPPLPAKDYELRQGLPRPPQKGKNETEKQFKERQSLHQEHVEKFNKKKEAFARKLAATGPRRMQYAQLVGLASVFGAKEISVTLRPHQQDVLAGFGDLMGQTVELLPAGRDDDDDDGDPDGAGGGTGDQD